MIKALLKEYIKQVLLEAAVTDIQHLALQMVTHPLGPGLVLYDPTALETLVGDVGNFYLDGPLFQLPPGSINGYIVIGEIDEEHGPCLDSFQVQLSAAEKGYGPIMYDMAMALSQELGHLLTADRIDISPLARNIWDFYENGRADVQSSPFDDIDNPKTPDPNDDCQLYGRSSLDSAYTNLSANSLRSLMHLLMQNSGETINKIIENNPNFDEPRLINVIYLSGREFFSQKFG